MTKIISENREMFEKTDESPPNSYLSESLLGEACSGYCSQLLVDACSKDLKPVKLSNKDRQNPHGKRIVEIFVENGQILEFVRIWRRHFLENHDAKFLPAGWRVDHKMEVDFGELKDFGK